MNIFESQYSNSVQKYGEEKTNAIKNVDKSLSEDYLYKMCQFVYDENVDVRDVVSLFRRVRAMFSQLNLGNLNNMTYEELCKEVGGVTAYDTTPLPNVIYQSVDGMITIGLLNNKNEAENLPISNSWCISRKNDPHDSFNELGKNSVFYIIRNLYFSVSSQIRFVICQVFYNDAHIFWTQDNERLEYEEEYVESLGQAANLLKYNNNNIKTENYMRNNKRTIRLTESDLHKIVKESVQTILKESNITPTLEQDMERYRDDPKRFMHTLHAFQLRYESILKDAEKMGLDDIAEIAKQRLQQISDEVIKAREQWNLHA